MQRIFLLLVCLFYFYCGNSQTPQSYALVVGISDYQYVNDLNYADDDADAFYSYLLSATNGRFKKENIRKITNSDATGASVISGLSWLMKTSKPGDLVVIYFAGHGGYEDLTFKKLGFLLAHDGFMDSYTAGGNIPLDYLNILFESFGLKEIRTIFIADACHSGKSTDHDVSESVFINSRLAADVGQVTKILSAQGSEKSLEDTRWGGGHGVFTYYLIKALIGFADESPKDMYVNLREVESYLNKSVSFATDYSQNPMVIGANRNLVINAVNERAYPVIQQILNDTTKNHNLIGVLSRGFKPVEHSVEIINNTQSLYDSIKRMYSEERYFHPTEKSALTYLNRLAATTKDSAFLAKINEEYNTKVMESVQRIMGKYMSGEAIKADDFLNASLSLKKVNADIKEKESPLYPLLRSQELFMRYYASRKKMLVGNAKDRLEYNLNSKKLLMEAIQINPDAAFLYNAMGLYLSDIKQMDSSNYFLHKAHSMSPRWLGPVDNLGVNYYDMNMYPQSLEYFDMAIKIKPSFPESYTYRGLIYFKYKKYDLSKQEILKSIDKLKESPYGVEYNINNYNALGNISLLEKDYENALNYFNKSLSIKPSVSYATVGAMKTHFMMDDYTKSIEYCDKILGSQADSLLSISPQKPEKELQMATPKSQQLLGYLLEKGISVKKNLVKSEEMYKQASESNELIALIKLYQFYKLKEIEKKDSSASNLLKIRIHEIIGKSD